MQARRRIDTRQERLPLYDLAWEGGVLQGYDSTKAFCTVVLGKGWEEGSRVPKIGELHKDVWQWAKERSAARGIPFPPGATRQVWAALTGGALGAVMALAACCEHSGGWALRTNAKRRQ